MTRRGDLTKGLCEGGAFRGQLDVCQRLEARHIQIRWEIQQTA